MLRVQVLDEHVQGALPLLAERGRVEGGLLPVDHWKRQSQISLPARSAAYTGNLSV